MQPRQRTLCAALGPVPRLLGERKEVPGGEGAWAGRPRAWLPPPPPRRLSKGHLCAHCLPRGHTQAQLKEIFSGLKVALRTAERAQTESRLRLQEGPAQSRALCRPVSAEARCPGLGPHLLGRTGRCWSARSLHCQKRGWLQSSLQMLSCCSAFN